MHNPLAKRLLVPQCPPNTESEVTGVRVHESRCNATIAPMAVNEDKFDFTHLPRLWQNLAQNSVEHDLSWMVAVKVDLHLSLPLRSVGRANRVSYEKEWLDYRSSAYGASEPISSAYCTLAWATAARIRRKASSCESRWLTDTIKSDIASPAMKAEVPMRS